MPSRLLSLSGFVLIYFTFTLQQLSAQPFSTGLTFDDEAYSAIPITAPLARGDFDNLPSTVDLRPYAPTPGNQGQTGTCTAWSSAYHARTIAESIRLGRTSKTEINQNTFSPSYVYNQIRLEPGCNKGTYIHQALELMSKEGVTKYYDLKFDCNRQVNSSDRNKAQNHKIQGYKILFDHRSNNKILPVKKSLSEKKPVVMGMMCANSFFTAKGVWTPKQEEYSKEFGGHAMVTVGYDDNKYGGSFLIMNSWGTTWGNDGFIWIRYSDYNHFVRYGFEMIDVQNETKALSGSLAFKEKDGSTMTATFDHNKGSYVMNKPYQSGTQFRFTISNHQPAYVYAIGSDLSKKSFRIFPHKDNISPYLGYKGNNVVIPGEKYWIRMDQNTGTDFFCVLYSSQALDVTAIMNRLEQTSGYSFKERLSNVLGDKLVSHDQIKYANNTIDFTSSFEGNGVIPIILEMEHR